MASRALFSNSSRRDELRNEMELWDLRAEEAEFSADEVAELGAIRKEYFKTEMAIDQSLNRK